MHQDTQNYLGIDWGSKNIGVALAHQETGVALGYATLRNDDDLLVHLGKIISLEEVATVVIGIPPSLNRADTTYEGEKLGRLLERNFAVTVAYQNEMFTTKMAQANLIERGVKQASKHDDEESARIILKCLDQSIGCKN